MNDILPYYIPTGRIFIEPACNNDFQNHDRSSHFERRRRQQFKDYFSFIFLVPKPILLKQTLETCTNEHDTSVLTAVFI